MDEHEKSTIPYPPEATGFERKMCLFFAPFGIIAIAAIVATMGAAMYLLPGAPPINLPLPLF
jgi:hypothetical protein